MQRFVILVFVMTLGLSTSLSAQDRETTPQVKVKELAFLIGEWQYESPAGNMGTQSIRWINNKSFIERVDGPVREVIGWDVAEKKFASWMFGGVGGHGKSVWTKKGDAWHVEFQPYYVANGVAVTNQVTISPMGADSIRVQGKFQDNEFDLELTRVKAED